MNVEAITEHIGNKYTFEEVVVHHFFEYNSISVSGIPLPSDSAEWELKAREIMKLLLDSGAKDAIYLRVSFNTKKPVRKLVTKEAQARIYQGSFEGTVVMGESADATGVLASNGTNGTRFKWSQWELMPMVESEERD